MSDVKKHILIADSDETTLIALEHLLEDEGFDTQTAWSTAEALALLEKGQFDLLLVADHPPEVNCELFIRRNGPAPNKFPVVVLENQPRYPFAEPYFLSLGAKGIVHKWQLGEVKNVVSGMLNSVSSQAQIAR
jgi:CheY-like chemotaxis protein